MSEEALRRAFDDESWVLTLWEEGLAALLCVRVMMAVTGIADVVAAIWSYQTRVRQSSLHVRVILGLRLHLLAPG